MNIGLFEVIAAAVVFVCAAIFVFAAIQSGLLPWALLFGVVVFAAVLIYTREFQLASMAGVIVAGLIAGIGVFNVLAPGWYNLG